jgi:hypothetical protein
MQHSHASFESIGALADHIDRHHPDVTCECDLDHDMHWHFVTPRELAHHAGDEGDCPPAETGMLGSVTDIGSIDTPEASGSSSSQTQPVGYSLLDQNVRCVAMTARMSRHGSPGFLAPRVRRCALLCVIRC